jgi:AbrB family looped-hinge helix DNA binding protein
MHSAVRLSSKGQVTIPKAIRDRLALSPGDRVVFRVRDDRVVVEPVGSLMDWYGAASDQPVPPEDWREVREQVRREIGRLTAAEGEADSDDTANASG